MSEKSNALREILNGIRERNSNGRGLSNHQGAVNIFAHGATELANILVHGHPAPMYAHNAAPPDIPQEAQQEANRAAMPLDDMKLDVQNVLHSEPITPQPTPAVNRTPQMER